MLMALRDEITYLELTTSLHSFWRYEEHIDWHLHCSGLFDILLRPQRTSVLKVLFPSYKRTQTGSEVRQDLSNN